jgi:uncharacterized membrane protein SirB2
MNFIHHAFIFIVALLGLGAALKTLETSSSAEIQTFSFALCCLCIVVILQEAKEMESEE